MPPSALSAIESGEFRHNFPFPTARRTLVRHRVGERKILHELPTLSSGEFRHNFPLPARLTYVCTPSGRRTKNSPRNSHALTAYRKRSQRLLFLFIFALLFASPARRCSLGGQEWRKTAASSLPKAYKGTSRGAKRRRKGATTKKKTARWGGFLPYEKEAESFFLVTRKILRAFALRLSCTKMLPWGGRSGGRRRLLRSRRRTRVRREGRKGDEKAL